MTEINDRRGKLAKELLSRSKEGKMTCAQARRLAEDLQVSYDEVGNIADELKVKIHKCQLGCF